jgi:hypothetical protein
MKRESCILRKMILGMFVLFAVGMGHAQYESQVLKVKIPFTFNVGTQTFPAGQYSLRPLLQNTISLRNEAGQVLTNIATNSVEASEAQSTMKLLFNGYGGQYFLAQIWQAGDSIGREVVRSSTEIEMARKYSPGQQIALRVVPHR